MGADNGMNLEEPNDTQAGVLPALVSPETLGAR